MPRYDPPPMKSLTSLIVTLALICTSATRAAEREPPPPEPAFKLQLLPVMTGLDKPVYLTHCGTKRVYVVEQTGKVRVWDEGKLLDKPFLDVSAKVFNDYECGLL